MRDEELCDWNGCDVCRRRRQQKVEREERKAQEYDREYRKSQQAELQEYLISVTGKQSGKSIDTMAYGYDVDGDVNNAVNQELHKRRVERDTALRLARMDKFGEDNYPVNTVIRFEKLDKGISKDKRTYIAVKVKDDNWSVVNYSSFDWDNLLTWLTAKEPVDNFEVANSWTPAEQVTAVDTK